MQELDYAEAIKRFVSKELDVDYNSLNMETDLISDLGVAGDDGFEFMEKFCAKFNIDNTDFDVYGVFGTEGFGFSSFIYLLLFPLLVFFRKRKPAEKIITIKHLLDSAISKRIISHDKKQEGGQVGS